MNSTEISFKQLIPLIRIMDVVVGKEFYVDWLGFQIDGEHRSGEEALLTMQISRGDLVLRLSEHRVKTPGALVIVHMTGIEWLHKELTDRKNNFDDPVPGNTTVPRNARQLTVMDPFSNRIMFTENTE